MLLWMIYNGLLEEIEVILREADTEIHEKHDFSIFKNFSSIFKIFTDFFVYLKNLLFFYFSNQILTTYHDFMYDINKKNR